MKHLLTLLLCVACGVSRADITSNLIYHWKFDNDLTEEVASNTFTETAGTATYTASGLPFSGTGTTHSLVVTSDDLLTSSSNCTGLTGAWTYAMWFKLGDNNTIFVNHNDSVADVYFRNSAGLVQLSANGYTINSTTTLTGGVWYHVAGTYDGTNRDGVKLYINGSLEATGSGAAVFGVADETIEIPSAAGKATNLDDLRVYSRELSPTDVTELYNFTGASSGSPLLRVLLESQ